MKAIAAADENWALGKDGGLLCHIPGDLKHFREMTLGKVIVVGRKTLESFPGGKPLPGRDNIVLTRNRDFRCDGCVICHSEEELLRKLAAYRDEDVFIAGGESIYRQFLPLCDTVYITKILEKFEADKHFENLDENADFHEVWQGEVIEEKGIRYRFAEYRRQ